MGLDRVLARVAKEILSYLLGTLTGMALAGTHVTADEFLAIPPGDRRYQLIDGEIVVNEPKLTHQRAVGIIYARLLAWVEAEPGRGYVGLPADIRVDDANVYAPDVWWVGEARRPRPEDDYLSGLPDLAIEVRSPSTWRRDRTVKRNRYEQAGLPELWLVDTVTAAVTVLTRPAPGQPFGPPQAVREPDVVTSAQLPGFQLALPDLFGS